MNPNNSSPPGHVNLEHVKVWYPCEGKSCSRMFYSIPLLKKHFEEAHPDEEFLLPLIVRPGTLEGRIIFEKGYSSLSGESVAGADASKGGTEAADSTTLLEGSKSSKKECGICHKIYENRSARNDHLKQQHGVVTLFDYDASDEELDSEGDNALKGEPSRSSENGGNSKKIMRKFFKKKVVLKPNLSKSCVMAKQKHFDCKICKKSFENIYRFKRHLMIHSGMRPFKCGFCKATSSRKDALEHHLIQVHKQERETAKTMANESALSYLKRNVKGKNNQELLSPRPRSRFSKITRDVYDDVLQKKGFKGATKSTNLLVKNNQKVGTTAKKSRTRKQKVKMEKAALSTNKKLRTKITGFSCNFCPFRSPSKKGFENHSKLHEDGSIAKACEVCGWFAHPSGMALHKMYRHPESNVTATASTSN